MRFYFLPVFVGTLGATGSTEDDNAVQVRSEAFSANFFFNCVIYGAVRLGNRDSGWKTF